jgi:hypothetical protein
MAFLEVQGIYRKPLEISTAGAPVDLGGGRLLSIVRDPNNLYLELIPQRR